MFQTSKPAVDTKKRFLEVRASPVLDLACKKIIFFDTNANKDIFGVFLAVECTMTKVLMIPIRIGIEPRIGKYTFNGMLVHFAESRSISASSGDKLLTMLSI